RNASRPPPDRPNTPAILAGRVQSMPPPVPPDTCKTLFGLHNFYRRDDLALAKSETAIGCFLYEASRAERRVATEPPALPRASAQRPRPCRGGRQHQPLT